MEPSPHSLGLEAAQDLPSSPSPNRIPGRDEGQLDTARRTIDGVTAGNNADVVPGVGKAGGKGSGTGVVAVPAYRNKANSHDDDGSWARPASRFPSSFGTATSLASHTAV